MMWLKSKHQQPLNQHLYHKRHLRSRKNLQRQTTGCNVTDVGRGGLFLMLHGLLLRLTQGTAGFVNGQHGMFGHKCHTIPLACSELHEASAV